MKNLYIFLALMFTMSACGFQSDWDGDWSKCDVVVDDACVVGLNATIVSDAIRESRKTFGDGVDPSGYLIEVVQSRSQTPCGEGAIGCALLETKHIWIVLDPNNINIAMCPTWVLGHEFGHIAIVDGKHSSPLWLAWAIRHLEICGM